MAAPAVVVDTLLAHILQAIKKKSKAKGMQHTARGRSLKLLPQKQYRQDMDNFVKQCIGSDAVTTAPRLVPVEVHPF
jgi:hypothetical protein